MQREVARDLEQEVADEEDAGAEAVDRAGEAEVRLELVLRERHVHAVQVRDDVEDEQGRHQAGDDLAHRLLAGCSVVSSIRSRVPGACGLKRCAAMRITGVHTAVVEANYDWTFVRVDAEGEGLSGIGECFCAPGLTAIVRDLAPLLIGEDARDVDRLWAKLRWGCSGAGSSAGIVYNAISGIEAALWDLVGQHYGVPIHRLLGGRFRDSRAHVRRLPRGRGAALDGRDDGRAPGALGAGAAGGDRRGRDPQPRARPRLRQGACPDEVFTPELYAARAQAGRRRPRLQRAEVRPRRADAVHAGHGVRDAVAGRDRATWSSSPRR